jgi:hypothetical protein
MRTSCDAFGLFHPHHEVDVNLRLPQKVTGFLKGLPLPYPIGVDRLCAATVVPMHVHRKLFIYNELWFFPGRRVSVRRGDGPRQFGVRLLGAICVPLERNLLATETGPFTIEGRDPSFPS